MNAPSTTPMGLARRGGTAAPVRIAHAGIDEPHGRTLDRPLAAAGRPLRITTPVRRAVAMMAGDYDAPCAVCGARPTALLVEWQTGVGVLGPGSPDGDVECSTTYEWRFYCLDHERHATGG